jgi:ribosome-associated protein
VTKAKPSKSARKREFLALQDLGEQLIDLTSEQLVSVGLDDALLRAILDTKNIKSHSALRRQKQLIGKLMRAVDPEPIHLALARFGSQDRLDKSIFQSAESWRDRIAAEGSTGLQAFYAENGQQDPQLDSLVAELGSATREAARRQICRRLFRALHRQISGRMHSSAE